MRKQDTAALNTHALVARVEELALKQYWLARKLDVTTRTVNRWMTGKVKRISRDNLERLAALLQLSVEELSAPDEADVLATRSEQARAADLLTRRETEALFMSTQQHSLFEQLLKATLHPDLTISQLAQMYNQLTAVAAMQFKFDEARSFAERGLEYAQRCGDSHRETALRTSLAIIDAEQGMLGVAVRKLELLLDLHESIGTPASDIVNIHHNLATAARLSGELAKSLVSCNYCLEYYVRRRHGLLASGYCLVGLLARDCARHALALDWLNLAKSNSDALRHPREKLEYQLYALEAASLLASAEGRPAPLPPELPGLISGLAAYNYLGDCWYAAAAGIYRRAGQLDAAQELAARGLAAASTRRYERALLQEELARIAAARGEEQNALRLLAEARAGFKAAGMQRRCSEDPALEVGSALGALHPKLKLPQPGKA